MLKKILTHIPFVRHYFDGMITIFALHRVSPFEPGKLYPNENMKVSPEFLENFIVNLKQQGYTFISLDRAYEILRNEEKVEKNIVFTLDDGYKDNYELAYPIFKKHNVPFTIYLTTSLPDNTAILWWYILEDLLLTNDTLILGDGRKYTSRSIKEKNRVFMEIRKLILSLDQKQLLNNLMQLFDRYNIDWFSKTRDLAMTWDQIVELSRCELCTIGNHTVNHLAFKHLGEEEIISEILKANQIIESHIGKKIEHFCYPYGCHNTVGEREFRIVKNLGFKTATTTRHGNLYPEHVDYLECLPRMMLTENFNIRYLGSPRRKRIVTI